jgi:hypothetical protein
MEGSILSGASNLGGNYDPLLLLNDLSLKEIWDTFLS